MDKEPKEEMEEGTPAEEAAETPDTEEKEMDAGEGSGEGVKVPEAFQKEAMALVSSCTSLACLDYLSSEVSEMRQKLMSSQKKSGMATDDFNTDGMPSE